MCFSIISLYEIVFTLILTRECNFIPLQSNIHVRMKVELFKIWTSNSRQIHKNLWLSYKFYRFSAKFAHQNRMFVDLADVIAICDIMWAFMCSEESVQPNSFQWTFCEIALIQIIFYFPKWDFGKAILWTAVIFIVQSGKFPPGKWTYEAQLHIMSSRFCYTNRD